MKKAAPPVHHDLNHEDAFLPYRDRIVYSLAIASAIVILPFAVSNFLLGYFAIAASMLGIVLILALDTYAIHHGNNLPIPLWTLVLPLLASLIAAILTPLYIDLAWSYPAIILFYFILPQRTANWLAGLVIVAVTLMSYLAFQGTEFHLRVTARLCASLALTAILSNVFINILTELQLQLRRQAIVDPLTGAYNRRHMDHILGAEYARAGRGAAAPSLLLIDLDHFKRINDDYGHGTGDQVLKGVVAVIQRHVRRSDVLFRCGGEEFALFLPETTTEGAVAVAEQVRKAVEESQVLEHRPVTISVGVAVLAPNETLDDWLRHGDDALYRAKSEGRNRVCIRSHTTASVMEL